MKKTALIIGVSGQDGAYLAKLLLDKGYCVHGSSRDAEANTFTNLGLLKVRDRIRLHSLVPTEFHSVLQMISDVGPDEIYNLSGQSSVSLSFSQPIDTMESIALGTLNLLEGIRMTDKRIRFYNAGSSECFGETGEGGADETSPFHPRSPYATAKAASIWTVSNYREAYGIQASTGILFNHESPLRHPRFVTRKIVRAAAAIAEGREEKLRLGNLDIERDWGWAPEYVEAIWRILQLDEPEDFVIGTGKGATLSEFVSAAFAHFGLDWNDHVNIDDGLIRPLDIRRSTASPVKSERVLGWKAETTMPDLVGKMARAEVEGFEYRP
ncbi:MAG TPA: GDP-mannose 4,6-dehydratase [Rhodospirillaceae bacterium]|nr:GDP-mannose 4,6-dehydratase [Rhodospirillaceae bacterium]